MVGRATGRATGKSSIYRTHVVGVAEIHVAQQRRRGQREGSAVLQEGEVRHHDEPPHTLAHTLPHQRAWAAKGMAAILRLVVVVSVMWVA